jgi:hypothetical protein
MANYEHIIVARWPGNRFSFDDSTDFGTLRWHPDNVDPAPSLADVEAAAAGVEAQIAERRNAASALARVISDPTEPDRLAKILRALVEHTLAPSAATAQELQRVKATLDQVAPKR